MLQEKGSKPSESAFGGETVRKFSGCKLLQSHSWARGHESVVSAMALLKDLTILFGDISVAFMNTPMPEGDLVYVDPP